MRPISTLMVLLFVTFSGIGGAVNIRSPTSEVLSRLLWLGDGDNTVQGSGTLVSHNGVEYLVTAHHLYINCGRNPSVRFRSRWNPIQWEVVAEDENLDVIVLKSAQLPKNLGKKLPVLYGMPPGSTHGQMGFSLGFPVIYESSRQLKTDHILETDDRPIPTAALVVVSLSPASKAHYSASYVNAGFSGGAVVHYVTDQEMWSIAGIITEFPTVPRHIYDGNGNETGLFTREHSGLVTYVPMSTILEMIDEEMAD